jgi:hypothetical protein
VAFFASGRSPRTTSAATPRGNSHEKERIGSQRQFTNEGKGGIEKMAVEAFNQSGNSSPSKIVNPHNSVDPNGDANNIECAVCNQAHRGACDAPKLAETRFNYLHTDRVVRQ